MKIFWTRQVIEAVLVQTRGDPARIVSVASRLHYLGQLDPKNMQLDGSPALVSLRAYSNSKLAQVGKMSSVTCKYCLLDHGLMQLLAVRLCCWESCTLTWTEWNTKLLLASHAAWLKQGLDGYAKF